MPKLRLHIAPAPYNDRFAYSTGGFVGTASHGSQWFFYILRRCIVLTAEWAR